MNYSETARERLQVHAKVSELQQVSTKKTTGAHKGEWTTASEHDKDNGYTQRRVNYSESVRQRLQVHAKASELERINTTKTTGIRKGE